MSDVYESERTLSEYLLFHYGSPEEILPPERKWPEGMREALGFPRRTAECFSPGKTRRGLDLGCAVGGATFAMAGNCESVVGIDFSHAFIRTATSLAMGETVNYRRLEEGENSTPLTARRPVAGGEVRFEQGDAMALRADLGAFDRVHAANLLCRLSDPAKLLDRLPDLVKRGGELVLATPCTWLEEFTVRSKWPVPDTFSWLKVALEEAFELTGKREEPFLIRETARKFQWSASLVTVWRRR